jgi:hypothetical protein
VIAFIGVLFESASVAVMISIALMFISGVLAQKDNVVKLLSSEWARQLWTGLYWGVPKVWDLGKSMMMLISEREAAWVTPAWTSAVFGAVVLAAAIQIFRKRDY